MKFRCLDSSSFTKLFVQEIGSEALRAYLADAEASLVFASALVRLEITSALHRRFRFGQLSQEDILQAQSSLTLILEGVNSVAVDARILRRSEGLISVHGLRSLDAIQLATASLMRELCAPGDSFTFVCSDQQLLFAAQKEHITVWNPAAAPPPAHPVN